MSVAECELDFSAVVFDCCDNGFSDRDVNDTALVRWLEADPERIAQFRAGNVIELAEQLPTEPVAIARRRVRGPASEITDERQTARRASRD